jgi:hypothetical protein
MVGAEGGAGTSAAIYSSLLRMLATCAAASPQVAHSLLELGLAATLAEALKGCVLLPSPSPAGPAASPSVATISRGSDQLTSLLQLLAQLLPPLPGAEPTGPTAPSTEATTTRRALLAAAPNLVAQYGDAAASVLLQVRPGLALGEPHNPRRQLAVLAVRFSVGGACSVVGAPARMAGAPTGWHIVSVSE